MRCVFSQSTALTLDDPKSGPPGWLPTFVQVARGLRTPADWLSCALFPAECVLCNHPLVRLGRAPVCEACLSDLPPQAGALCLCCGEALGAHAFAGADRAPGDWLCRPCRVSPPHFERAVAHGLYRGSMRALLHLLKYDGLQPVSRQLGERIFAVVAAQPAVPERFLLIPVPLFARKQTERGFNQAELLAQAAARAARKRGLPWTVDGGLLRRVRGTESQAQLTPRQRRLNLQKAFAVADDRARRTLAGRDCLLVDDIYTTGATARAASRVLREAGAASVWVATAARAQKQEMVAVPEPPMEQDVAFWS